MLDPQVELREGETHCKRCEGTGNQLFNWYQRCTDCDGSGKARPVRDPNAPLRVPWSRGDHKKDCQTLITPHWTCDCGAASEAA